MAPYSPWIHAVFVLCVEGFGTLTHQVCLARTCCLMGSVTVGDPMTLTRGHLFLGCPLLLTGSPGGLCRSGQARLVETWLDSSHCPRAPTELLPTSDFLDGRPAAPPSSGSPGPLDSLCTIPLRELLAPDCQELLPLSPVLRAGNWGTYPGGVPLGGELTETQLVVLLQAAQLSLLACWWSGLPSFPQASEAPTLTWTNLPSPFRPLGGGAFLLQEASGPCLSRDRHPAFHRHRVPSLVGGLPCGEVYLSGPPEAPWLWTAPERAPSSSHSGPQLLRGAMH